MDSGCTYDMCLVNELFETLELKERCVVLLGNNKICKVQNTGSIILKMFNNQEILLQDVRYASKLRRNFFY